MTSRVAASTSSALHAVLSAVAKTAARLCEARDAQIALVEGDHLRHVVHYGLIHTGRTPGETYPLGPGTPIGHALSERRIVHIRDMARAVRTRYPEMAATRGRSGSRTVLAAPLLRDGTPVGGILIRRRVVRPFTAKQITLLKTFADQAALAIDNARLSEQLEAQNQTLSEALEQQTATSEILRVISSSPTQLQPVLDAVAENAARVCGADDAIIQRTEGDHLRIAAHFGSVPVPDAALMPIRPDWASGKAILERRTFHVPDMLEEHQRGNYPGSVEHRRRIGYRTVLITPLLREGTAIGLIVIRRMAVKPFTDKQIALFQTFADQAVIAIENVRLFTELQASNRELSEALEQQTATSEILRVISRSPTDIQPVLDAVAANATRVCGATDAIIMRVEGPDIRRVAHFGPIPLVLPEVRRITDSSGAGRAILECRAIHIHDVLDPDLARAYPETAEIHRGRGWRTTLAVPLVREGVAIGAIVIRRTEVRPFTEKQIQLLETFADQAVIAIENVRLFTELQARNRDLTEALEQQTATGEILRVISSSPTDVRPTFEAIATSAARLCEAEDGSVFRFDGSLIHLVGQRRTASDLANVVRQAFPMPPGPGSATARAILTSSPVHIPDITSDSEYSQSSLARAGFRSVLSVPMLREGEPIGAITVSRSVVRPFSDAQLALLKTFADQALIAIENVRLFTELQARNRDLTDALERQTATAGILRAISQAQTDVQPVFDAIVESALSLCDGTFSGVYRVEGDLVHQVAHNHRSPESLRAIGRDWPMPVQSPASLICRVIREQAVLHVSDVESDPTVPELARERSRAVEQRSLLVVPMLREGVCIGAIRVSRREPTPFSETHVELLKTFADQAVIAVENARLLTQLQARNRDLTEALEQQTATSEILRVISSSPTDIQPVLDAVVHNASRLCDAKDAQLFRVDGEVLRLAASFRGDVPVSAEVRAHGVPLQRDTVTGRSVLDRRAIHVHDILAELDTEYPGARVFQQATGMRTVLAVPLLRENDALGAILIRRFDVRPFSEKQITLLQTFADQAVIAIENVRLFTELQTRNRALAEALEQQTATAEILRAISSSPTDTQPIFDVIVRNAAQLCDALYGLVFRHDAGLLHLVAHHNLTADQLAEYHRVFPRPVTASPLGRATMSGHVLNIPDVEAYPEAPPESLALWRSRGVRSILSVPLRRQTEVVGQIGLSHRAVGAFTDSHVELLKTFADQAVIAIENVRLFTELQARNRDLTEALEQQTATGEILRAISSSPTDAQPVFETIVRSAVRLCGARFGNVFRLEGEVVHLAAFHNHPLQALEQFRNTFPQPLSQGGTITAEAMRRGVVVHIHDLELQAEVAPAVRELSRSAGYRSALAVPILRKGTAVGAIGVGRSDATGAPRPFSDKEVQLLETFADQAVIAIENVRLFTELQARNRDLTEALEQQTATGEILGVISSSPTDIQPVFDTIVRSAVRLCDAIFSSLVLLQDDRIHLAAHHNFTPEGLAAFQRRYPLPLDRDSLVGQTILDRAAVHAPDVEQSGPPTTAALGKALGYRCQLAVPLLREANAIGAIAVFRRQASPFSDSQIQLLETFADQAVIAIENVRLFTELQEKNQALTQAHAQVSEALEQQTATAEILRVISSSPTDLQPVLDAVAERAARLCGADDVNIHLVDGETLRLTAKRGRIPTAETRPITRARIIGRAVLGRRTIHIHDVQEAREEFPDAAIAEVRTSLATPLLREGVAIGVIHIRRREVQPFAEKQIRLLETFADQAVIAIENVRLFKELQERNRALTDALERQTATSEILGIISQSHTDTQPVFDAIIRSAVRLCAGTSGSMVRVDGDMMHLWAHYNYSPEAEELVATRYPAPISERSLVALAVRTRAPVHASDFLNDPRIRQSPYVQALGVRAQLTVPLLRGDEAIGTLNVLRNEPGPFSESQIDLLQTFAAQAVIAIENVRLFNELQARTAQLTHSVEQLTALGEVSRALSSTLDLETVLQTIVARANQLAGTDACSVSEYDEAAEEFRLRATNNLDEKVVAVARRTPIRKGEGVQGQMAITRQPVQISDIVKDNAYRGPLRDVLLRSGTRSLLAIPLLREDHLVGSLTVTRKTPGEFSSEVIELLQTFATQSALAIQNARLFREIEDQSRQLEVASRHKSQFLANMSHELRTPLNAILGYTELIGDNIYGEVPERMREVLERVEKSGRHLLGLINDILDLSKIEAGQLTLALNDYAMQDVVRSVASATEPLARAKGLGLEVAVPDDLPIGHADERRLMQVLLNLVGNALKFTEVGKVAIRAELVDATFRVAVADTGPGIAEGDRERIFEEFQQADSAVARVKGGTGLGLAIARRIIEMHGGQLWLESTIGVGSTFTFTVPVRVEQQVAVTPRRPLS